MKIAVDVLSIRPDGSAGGATGFAIELIKGFANSRGNRVYVLCAEWNYEYLKGILPSNVRLLLVGTQKKITGIQKIDGLLFQIFGRNRKTQMLKAEGIDILYCPFSAVTNKELGIPAVSTILDIQHEYYPQFFAGNEQEHRRNFYREIVKKAEVVTCISDYTKQTFCEKYGYPLERAYTIYIAIQNRFDKEDDGIFDRLKISGKKYIIYPANFWEHKNHKLMLCAFAMYVKENSDAFLVLTGNPLEKKEYYEKLLEGLQIKDKVVITGYITNEELYSLSKHAKGLIFPSLFEGFGIPVVEAMQQHLLIACSNSTSLPEIGCESIFYFDPKKPDEITNGFRYLYETEITDNIIADYEEKLKAYQSENMVQQYLDLFAQVISDKNLLVFEECCTGIFADGWAGKQIYIQLKNKMGKKIHFVFELPEFVKSVIGFRLELEGNRENYHIQPGSRVEIEKLISAEHSIIKMEFRNCWSPYEILHSEDKRELSVMVNAVEIINEDGNCTPVEKD